MRSNILSLSVISALGLSASPALAQPTVADVSTTRPAPPALFVAGTAERLGLTRVSIEASIVGHLSRTSMTLTFGNTTDRRLAGDLYVPLPPGATVSGYALDVAGRMVDGVVVEREEARRIFEAETRKGVDPGLVAWTRGNVFKTRVFPVEPQSSRTIRLSWVVPLTSGDDGAMRYRIPLAFEEPLAELSLRVEVVRGAERPRVETFGRKGPVALSFDERLVAATTLRNQPVVQDLAIVVPDVARRPVQIERSADGSYYFNVRDEVRPDVSLPRITPERVRVLWDASLSRQSADRSRELGLLRRYLAGLGSDTAVELVVVRNEASAPRSFTVPAQLESLVAAIASLPNDGGTQLGRLTPPPGARPVDLVLVFSDGLSTFGEDTPGALGAPTWVISSSAQAGHPALERLAADNGGVYLELGSVSDDQALARIGTPVWSVRVEIEDGEVDGLTPAGSEPVTGATNIAGVLVSDQARLRVSWGVAGRSAGVVRRYELRRSDAASAKGETLRFAWAQKQLARLLAQPAKNAERMVELGKAHSIVTPGTSLLVLESLDQYLEHRVRPPASWPEMRADWDREIEQQRIEARKSERERLAEVLEMWQEEVAWYQRRFTYPRGFRFGADDGDDKLDVDADGYVDGDVGGYGAGAMAVEERTVSPMVIARPARIAAPSPEPKAAEKKKEAGAGEAPPHEPGVVLAAWDPDTPYLTALKTAPAKNRMAVYLEQREQYGKAPSFYLDCADFFLKQDELRLGLQILSNVTELRLDDAALLRVVAHRLAQLDQLTTAATIFTEVLRLRPEEPQSHRDLALVLARRAAKQKSHHAARADWQGALDHLAAIVKKPWDRFQGIEVIALTELNRFWAQARPAGATMPLDDRFIHPMELDMRIVMTWDADATDMDLHVIEPSGEKASYENALTTIGGKVSRDFTEGYGPEVYGLKRAMHGKYTVKTHFYGSSAAQLIGAVTLQVDVFTNWGRPNEKRRSMTLRLTESEDEFIVGELEF